MPREPQPTLSDSRAQIAALRDEPFSLPEFVACLAGLYRENCVEVARILDEEVDRSGRLLGLVRQEVRSRG